MAKAKVALFANPSRAAIIELGATIGATIGVDLKMPDGTIATIQSLTTALGVTASSGTGVSDHRLLQGLSVGDDHPQYTRRDTLTTRGDIYYRNATVVTRLALGSANQLLRSNGTDLVYVTISPTLTLSTDVTGSATFTNLGNATLAVTISANAVTDAKFRQSSAVSVVGRSANSAGDVADISAAADDTVFRRTGATLNFGQLTVGMFPASVVTYAKIQNVSADHRVLGRISTGAGVIEELTADNVTTIINGATIAFAPAKPPVLPNFTVATLPAAATAGAGAQAFVTDANATIIAGLGTTVVGGGTNKVPVYSDGTNWIIG